MLEKSKIIKSFCVVGLNENLIQKYIDEEIPDFIQDIDILVKKLPYLSDIYKPEKGDEKWIRILKDKNVWLRIKYSKEYNIPITELKAVECEYESSEFLLLSKEYVNNLYKPIMVTISKDDDNNTSFPIIHEFEFYKPYNDFYVKIPAEFDIKDIMNCQNKSKASILLISRTQTSLPLKDLVIQRKKNRSYNFGISRHKSPYSFKYMPEILDYYPLNTNVNNGVSLFCFPEGISIKDTYEMPKWFSFVLTDEIGERTYGSTLIFYEDDKKIIESFIPIYKEKDIKKGKQKLYFFPKAICVLSRYPFFYNCKLFLNELYRLQVSSKPKIPLERVICAFVDNLYIQNNDSILRFIINEKKLDFYRIPNYGELWDTNNDYLEVMFHVLSFQQIITAWQGLLLEKKLFLLCSSKSTLLAVAHGLINLLFPFKWIHVFVPILPEKLKVFIDSPVPLIVGISYPIELNELPNDALILNINKNRFENYYEKMPKLPGKIKIVLEKKLSKIKEKYNVDNPVYVDQWMDYQDEVTPAFELEKYQKMDTTEIRDVFYDVFIHIFKNYMKYFDWNNKEKIINENSEETTAVKFIKSTFLKDHSSQEENSFLALFSETALFSQLENAFSVIKVEKNITFFINSIKNGRGEYKVYLPHIIPQKLTLAPQIETKDLPEKKLFYNIFPKLDQSLYINSKEMEKIYTPKFIYYKDEWCYDINKLKKKEIIKYFIYSIYEIWFYFFSFIIHFYSDKDSLIFMDFAISLLEDLVNNKKISPTRNLFAKIFKSSARNELSMYIKRILCLVNQVNKGSKYTKLFHNQYLTGLYALTENIGLGPNCTITLGSANSYLNLTTIRNNIMTELSSNEYDNKKLLNSFIFLNGKICPNCSKNKKLRKMTVEEILSGFPKDNTNSYVICLDCFEKIKPIMYYLKNNQSNLNVNSFNLLSPFHLKTEIDNLIKRRSEIAFYQKIQPEDNLLMNIYMSIVYYFQLLDLPLFVLYIPNNENVTDELIFDLNENKRRRNLLVTKSKKSGVSVSPDRKNKSIDTSSDNKSNTGDGSSIFSRKSTLTNAPAMESDIWKNIASRLELNEMLGGEKISSGEKSDFISKIKEMKITVSKIILYFMNLSKEKLDNFLLDQENEKQESQVEIKINKEKEKEKEINNTNQIKINNNGKGNESIRKFSDSELNNNEIESIKDFNLEEINTINFGGIKEINEENKDVKNENNKKDLFNISDTKLNDNNKINFEKKDSNIININKAEEKIKSNIMNNDANDNENNIGHSLTHDSKNPIKLQPDKDQKETDKVDINSDQKKIKVERYGSVNVPSIKDLGNNEIKKSRKKKIKITQENFCDFSDSEK